ncbi:MAG TPA: ribosome maturation factor RimM [Candidatus Acidoferrales bacterium]|nr:ribosome maturation factor RimM [Candidatus Acidoferrales bacterium]
MDKQPAAQSDRVTVARILRPHGRRGEVACEILSDFPQRFKSLQSVELIGVRSGGAREAVRENAPRRVAVRSCWLSQSRGGQAIFLFEGSDSISDAEKLVGLEVQIPLSERVHLPSGSYYITDLAGCEVRESSVSSPTGEPGATIGRVTDVQMTGGTPILVVDSPQGEVLIPLAQDICVRVDTAAREIDVVLPEGLRDLNT